MPIKKYLPTSAGRRFVSILSSEDITKDKPEKRLTLSKKRKAGRNSNGIITLRHRGGGHKRRIRIIDYLRNKEGIQGKVVAIEYDPNRTTRIGLVNYADGEKRYIILPKGVKVGSKIEAGKNVDIIEGNALPISEIPTGTLIHNVELVPGRGGKLVRSAGTFAQIVAKEGKHAHVRLPSGEIRLLHVNCKATIGQVGNEEQNLCSLGKAGRTRYLGIKPTVRGTAMNPCDHPHGGGEGKNKSAGRQPVSPWGVLAKGGKTRSKRKNNKVIVQGRKKARR